MLMNWKQAEKQEAIRSIQQFFYDERGEEIGVIAAEAMLDFVGTALGPYYYNEGLKDARRMVNDRLQSIEDDLYALERK
ncbi:hypothetical protein A374_07749 [Fictibacillus macauensis ZFHKF-1]|uniref:DUF2164 domain-containing protein n=1 Tax=Fictibacillus macauensis ZFHKF-1 TaxID=1196324 RepID=I8J1U5_9BACL|nr:DUF2164 domain-containing protein [Fictibacillus macauensis]EIT85711.1 hypothetical protein A374_07749 [Fictibacillus macauensis ZFHKF-1]